MSYLALTSLVACIPPCRAGPSAGAIHQKTVWGPLLKGTARLAVAQVCTPRPGECSAHADMNRVLFWLSQDTDVTVAATLPRGIRRLVGLLAPACHVCKESNLQGHARMWILPPHRFGSSTLMVSGGVRRAPVHTVYRHQVLVACMHCTALRAHDVVAINKLIDFICASDCTGEDLG